MELKGKHLLIGIKSHLGLLHYWHASFKKSNSKRKTKRNRRIGWKSEAHIKILKLFPFFRLLPLCLDSIIDAAFLLRALISSFVFISFLLILIDFGIKMDWDETQQCWKWYKNAYNHFPNSCQTLLLSKFSVMHKIFSEQVFSD